MGFQDDLKMAGNDFSWLATAFFIAYAIAEVPQATLLQKFAVKKVLGINVFFWGVILCCSSAVNNYAGLLALRILLGFMEAVIGETLSLYDVNMLAKFLSSVSHIVYEHVVYSRGVNATVRLLVLWPGDGTDNWGAYLFCGPACAPFPVIWWLENHVRSHRSMQCPCLVARSLRAPGNTNNGCIS